MSKPTCCAICGEKKKSWAAANRCLQDHCRRMDARAILNRAIRAKSPEGKTKQAKP